ncbi:hypothetical protein HYV57_04385 [Candidatus Peregrinibacteria bacterium]|nr:hypothetical protein [Candidatus Peregrinibacteria bacterium]
MVHGIDGIGECGRLPSRERDHGQMILDFSYTKGADHIADTVALTRIDLGSLFSLVMPHGEALAARINRLTRSSDIPAMSDGNAGTSLAPKFEAQTQPDADYRKFLEELEKHPQTFKEDFWEGVESCGDFACTAVKGTALLFLLVSILGIRMVRRLFRHRS